ncbi:MAG: NAD+ synthase [Coleofasciculaceae cyanobacterium SM2_1_6]|nr:NAD+ synthase [Coleofasciculaceae cyanobacterium SM2_1_6]
MKIAIAQLNPTIGDLINNSNQILQAAQQVADQGVDLLITPELSLCGYPPRDLLLKSSFLAAMTEQLAQLASQLPPDLYVLVGTIQPNSEAEIKGQKPLFNSVACLYQGQVQEYFQKRLLPTYDVFDEDRYFAPGEKTGIFRMVDRSQSSSPELTPELNPESNPESGQEVTIGVTICEDLWNDEEFWGKRSYGVNPIAELGAIPVDLVVNLSASPYCVGKQKVREAMISHSAKHYQRAIIYVNQVGGNDDLIFDGGSFACDRTGKLIHRAATFRPDLTILEFDRNDLLPGEIKTPAGTTPGEIWQALVLGVQDYARKCGFQQVVLGLSGGVDSALVAAIATAALGAENVWGILMPSPYSSEHSVSDALELAQILGIHTQTLPIGDLMQGFDRTLEPLFAGTKFGIAEENIQSRSRGTLLMAIANKFGYLLLSTGNKSEMAVGYCTLYGDMNGGLAVIADVPKTQVYAVCDWLNATHPQLKIPQHILTKAPSAELKPGQVDQDSLPAYEILDEILDRLICQHQSPTEIITAGFDRPIVEQVVKLVTRAEFKRRQAPPGLKITDRAFGTGWRMPIAARWS